MGFCHKCGSVLASDACFCSVCGAAVPTPEQPETTVSPPQVIVAQPTHTAPAKPTKNKFGVNRRSLGGLVTWSALNSINVVLFGARVNAIALLPLGVAWLVTLIITATANTRKTKEGQTASIVVSCAVNACLSSLGLYTFLETIMVIPLIISIVVAFIVFIIYIVQLARKKPSSNYGFTCIVFVVVFIAILILVIVRPPIIAGTSSTEPNDHTVEVIKRVEKEFKDSCESVDYTDVARNPSSYYGTNVMITGEVLQVTEIGDDVILRVGESENKYDNVWYITYTRKNSTESRILEGDTIVVYGTCKGTKTYTTVLRAEVTIPYIDAEYIKIEQE